MNKKFNKFNYQLVDSTHKGYKEVLVTFEYKEKPCHYYSFIKEASSMNNKKYIDASKDEIQEMIKNGQLEKCAKRYLGYKISDEEKAVLAAAPIAKTGKQGKVVVQTQRARRTMPQLPFLFLIILGGLLLVAGGYAIFRSFVIGNWPEYVLTAEEKLSVTIHLYSGIGLGVLALASLGVGIPLFIKKIKK